MTSRALMVATLYFAASIVASEEPSVTLEDVLTPSEPLPAAQLERLALVERHLERDPQPLVEGNRLTYLFGVGQPSLICAPFRICTLALAPGERIAEDGLLIGAATMWHVVQIYVAGNDAVHISLIPKDAGLRTSLTILTKGEEARYYHVDLISDPEAYMPLVAFRYESHAREAINAMVAKAQGTEEPSPIVEQIERVLPDDFGNVSINDLYFGYELSGCRSCAWRPERVFDDGTRTIIVLPEASSTQPLPALLIVGAESDSQVFNYRFQDPSYVVDGLFDEARLSLGVGRRQQEISIRRKSR